MPNEKSTNTNSIQDEGDRRNETPEAEAPKEWQCGESYRFPLPAPESDPWHILLTPILEKDKARCDAWQAEVQNLLIFAGLFSAVVTAFIIETYKGLQQDPNDAVILLLSRIALDLENGVDNTSASSRSPNALSAFSPSPSIVRVNIFLFISLILSLATALIGIVALQWLREHQSYTGSFTSQNTFAAVHMRLEALEKWRVPEIFSALPLILQSALILFFIGIIDFLSDIDMKVVIPIASVIGLVLVFLLFTTMLPTIQGFVLHHPILKLNNEVPVQCPYKSPQSRAFRRLIASSEFVFYATSITFAMVYWVSMRLCLFASRIRKTSFYRRMSRALQQNFGGISTLPSHSLFKLHQYFNSFLDLNNSEAWNGFDYMTGHIHSFWSVKSSFDFDLVWLLIRDNYFQSTCNQDSWLYKNRFAHQEQGASYDGVRGLREELMKDDINTNADLESSIFVAYHCALDLSAIKNLRSDEHADAVRTHNAYLAALLGYNQLTPLNPFPNVVENAPLDVLWDETAFLLLDFAYSKLNKLDLSSPRLSRHLAEVSFRLLRYLYSQPHLTYMSTDSDDGPPDLPLSADDLYVMKIFGDKGQPFTTQWALVIHLYFRAFDDPNNTHIDFKNNFHRHPIIRELIENFWKEVDDELSQENIHPDTLKQILRTFHLIDGILKNIVGTESGHLLECIFYPAALYIHSCRYRLRDHDMLNETIDVVIPTLALCKNVVASRGSNYEYLVGSSEYDEEQTIVIFSEEWWKVLFTTDQVSHSRSNSIAGDSRHSRHSAEASIAHHGPGSKSSRSSSLKSQTIAARVGRQIEVSSLPSELGRGDAIASDENKGVESLV